MRRPVSEISKRVSEWTKTKEEEDDMEEMEAILTKGSHLERGLM